MLSLAAYALSSPTNTTQRWTAAARPRDARLLADAQQAAATLQDVANIARRHHMPPSAEAMVGSPRRAAPARDAT